MIPSIVLAALCLGGGRTAMGSGADVPLRTVDHVDLQRYSGKWYEIARLPNRFEAKCSSNVISTYQMQGNNVAFQNTCTKHDGMDAGVKGKARVVDPASEAKLKVTIFWPFSVDYWIIGLDPEYQWAVVGEPSRKYLWVLSRTPALPESAFAAIRKQVDQQGYRSAELQLTPQNDAKASPAPSAPAAAAPAAAPQP